MSTPSPTVPSARAAFAFRDFRLYQTARLLTIVGLEMQSVAVGWQMYDLTHRPLDLGLVGLAQFLPGILLFLLAGHTADRFDRRNILLVCYSAFGLCSLLLFWHTLSGAPGVAQIYVILVLLGIVRAFNGPAGQALMPQLVPREHFPNAVALGATVFQIATILGPAVGGVLYGWTKGADAVYGTAVGCFALALLMALAMEIRTGRLEHRAASLETVLAGFRYVWREKVILGSISLDLFAVLLGGAVALLPVFAREILRVGPWGLGLMRSAPAAGATLMAVILAHRPLQRRAGVTMLWCVAGFGVFTVVFGLSRNLVLSLVALFFVGALDMVSVIIRATVVQIATPQEMRGRVSAVNLLFIGASNEFGQFESGLTAQWLGTIPAVVIGGIGTLIVVASYAWRFPQLRKVDKLTGDLLSSEQKETAPQGSR